MWIVLTFLFWCIFTSFAFSDIVISEIMYSGNDDYDWFEIYNDGDSVNVSQIKFYENGNRHNLFLKSNDEILETGKFAIIANDCITFNLSFPNFNATLIDSSFSLPSTGRTIILNYTEQIAYVYYNSSFGANVEGISLSLINGTP